MEPVIQVSGLHKAYGDFEAVRGIDFDVSEGEIFGLLGPNGAGKTTTVEILEGLRARSQGQVKVLGFDPEVSKRVMNVDIARPFCCAGHPLWHGGSGLKRQWPRRGYKRWASHLGGGWTEHLSPRRRADTSSSRRETWPC